MASTTPNFNIVSPTDQDEWDVTSDLGTMASSVDAALLKSAYLPFETKAALDAYSTTNLNKFQLARVTNDSTTLNNGEYMWNGTKWGYWNIPDISAAFTLSDTGYTFSMTGASVTSGWVHMAFGLTYNRTDWAPDGSWVHTGKIINVPTPYSPGDSAGKVFPASSVGNNLAIGLLSAGVEVLLISGTMSKGAWVGTDISWKL